VVISDDAGDVVVTTGCAVAAAVTGDVVGDDDTTGDAPEAVTRSFASGSRAATPQRQSAEWL
jgi:hypothetical protein